MGRSFRRRKGISRGFPERYLHRFAIDFDATRGAQGRPPSTLTQNSFDAIGRPTPISFDDSQHPVYNEYVVATVGDDPMVKYATLVASALLLVPGYAYAVHHTMTSGRPSAVLNTTKCSEVWKHAVPTGDTLAKADAGPYIVNWHMANPDNDASIDKKEFFSACRKGLVKYTKY
ncbi:MAG: hypothetical protein AB1508_14415 [Pseudomonadota bacterium]